MKASQAQLYLQCRRPGSPTDSTIEKALRFAENEAEMKRKHREQLIFDEQVIAAIQAIEPPSDLKKRLADHAGAPAAKAKVRPQFTVPIILTMVCGVLSIIGLLVVMEMDHLSHFPGREWAERMVDAANNMTGVELEPVKDATGQLGDWFFLHGFENYAAPPEMAAMPAVGVRVLRIDGKPIAQVAVDQHDCILYTFRGSDFGMEIPEKADWTVFDYEGWAGALRRKGDLCSMVIFRGSQPDMEQFVKSLH